MSTSSAIRKVIHPRQQSFGDSACVVVFIHFHPRGFVAPGYLKLIRSAIDAQHNVVFVSTTRPSQISSILPMDEITYVHRYNIGYDFGALHDVRQVLLSEAASHGRVVILNSSILNVASPGFCNDPALDQLVSPSSNQDLFGITSSYECQTYHIQTYFYSISSTLFQSTFFKSFLNHYMAGIAAAKLKPRTYAIKQGELKLTGLTMNAGYSVSSFFNDLCMPSSAHYATMSAVSNAIESLLEVRSSKLSTSPGMSQDLKTLFLSEWISRPGLQTNISQACWALMLAKGFRFIKRELLEAQPGGIPIAPSAPALLLPLLEALKINIPSWSDLHILPHVLYASRKVEKGHLEKSTPLPAIP